MKNARAVYREQRARSRNAAAAVVGEANGRILFSTSGFFLPLKLPYRIFATLLIGI